MCFLYWAGATPAIKKHYKYEKHINTELFIMLLNGFGETTAKHTKVYIITQTLTINTQIWNINYSWGVWMIFGKKNTQTI